VSASATAITPPDAFVLGWRKLPDELKLEIVRHALPSGITFVHSFFKKETVPVLVSKRDYVQRVSSTGSSQDVLLMPYDAASVRALQHADVFEQSLLPLLACPDTANVVDEAFK
jgi:hypothetical protein